MEDRDNRTGPGPGGEGGEPLVSVFCPSYNHENFIRETLESIAAQSWRNLEVILIDDGSTDRTAEIAAEFAGCHPGPFRFRRGRKNRGTVARWNEMIGRITGDFLVAVGSDDILPPDGIRRRVEQMIERPRVDLLLTDFDVLTADNRLVRGKEKLDVVPQFEKMYQAGVFDRLYDELLRGNFVHPGAACYRVGSLLPHELRLDPATPNLHDYDQLLKIARRGNVAFLDEPTYVYRWHRGNTSASENPAKDLLSVAAEMSYVLSRHLIGEQTPLQRATTLRTIEESLRGPKAVCADRVIHAAEEEMERSEWERARELLSALLAFEPDNTGALNDLSVVAAQEGDREEALQIIDRILRLRPDDEVARSNRTVLSGR